MDYDADYEPLGNFRSRLKILETRAVVIYCPILKRSFLYESKYFYVVVFRTDIVIYSTKNLFIINCISWGERKKKRKTTSDGTRTRNPRLRRPVPYPLGHGGIGREEDYKVYTNVMLYAIDFTFEPIYYDFQRTNLFMAFAILEMFQWNMSHKSKKS